MSALIGALRVTLGLDSAAFEKGAATATGSLGKMQIGLKGLATAFATYEIGDKLAELVSHAVEYASALEDDAKKIGVTVEALQELRLAAKENGVEAEQVTTALARMNKAIGQLELGSGPAVKAFAQLGLSVDELKGKTPEVALGVIADALNKMPDPAQRAAVAQQLFGRSYAELLPLIDKGSRGLEEAANKQRAMGEVSTETAKNLHEAEVQWDAFKTAVVTATANVVGAIIPMAEKVGAALDATRATMAHVHDVIVSTFTGGLTAIREFATGVQTWLRERVGAIFDWFADKLKWLGDQWNKLSGGIGQGTGKMHASLMTFAAQGSLQLASFGDTAEAVTVKVQKSFKDMADATLSALGKLTSSIKSGGFLDILSAVIGLGLQLGSVGLFGSTIANRINNPAGGKTAPKLTIPSSGSFQVAGLSAPANNNTLTILPSPLFAVYADQRAAGVVAQAAPAIQQGTLSQLGYLGSRRLA